MMESSSKAPAVAQVWRGRTRPEVADEYAAYNYAAGIKPLIGKELGVQALREGLEDETEFMTISNRESIEPRRDRNSRMTGASTGLRQLAASGRQTPRGRWKFRRRAA